MRNNILIASLITLFILLIIFQMRLVASLDTKTDKNSTRLAYEIIEMSSNNLRLQAEVNELTAKNDNFSFDIKDRVKVREDIGQKIKDYSIINGVEPISGRGIELTILNSMVTEEIVDLVNGIRNAKPNALGINGDRVIYNTSFIVEDGKLKYDILEASFPVSVQILGDPDELSRSIDRLGGVLDILKKNSFGKLDFKLEKKEKIDLPAYGNKINFRFMKTIN
ncbi:DUF881 domain-containing protein [Candidatus Microgenomates bacterium]|nr:DUF881 domain-containing protein [Candidatus Microgenomates bacterium]